METTTKWYNGHFGTRKIGHFGTQMKSVILEHKTVIFEHRTISTLPIPKHSDFTWTNIQNVFGQLWAIWDSSDRTGYEDSSHDDNDDDDDDVRMI